MAGFKIKAAVVLLAAAATPGARAAEPDGLILPPGFHASVVASGIKGLRHLAVRPDGDLYASTRGAEGSGIVAIHLDRDRRMASSQSFGSVAGGTGLRLYDGWLYASSPTAIYRFRLAPGMLVPAAAPELVVDGLPAKGFSNRVLAFDARGGLFVGVGGGGNICADETPGSAPVGRRPCPDLATRAGVWRFAADRPGQHFPADGERYVTGLRDIDALDWRAGDALYGVTHGRNGTAATWPQRVTSADEDAIGEDMYRFAKGDDLGWPYTYYDSVRRRRVDAPEYGDAPPAAPAGGYTTPLLSLPAHAAPLDMLFYRGRAFPPAYRGGAFVALHGGLGPDTAEGRSGYSVAFVPFGKAGPSATWATFADGFAGATPASRTVKRAAYRPVGLAEAPDGALYVADSVQGRIWRITYTGK